MIIGSESLYLLINLKQVQFLQTSPWLGQKMNIIRPKIWTRTSTSWTGLLSNFYTPTRTANKGDCDNNITLGSDMPWTIPSVVFTILASYALWESHAPYKKRQRLRRTVAFVFFVYRSSPDQRVIITSFPAISKPGGSLEVVMRWKSKSG